MTILAVGIDQATINLLNISSDSASGVDDGLNDELQEALSRELDRSSPQSLQPPIRSSRAQHACEKNLPESACQHGVSNIFYTADISQAIDTAMANDDISLIIIDSKASKCLAEEIIQLLGSTLLTTKILILTHPDDLINRENYSALGVLTQSSPHAKQTLSAWS